MKTNRQSIILFISLFSKSVLKVEPVHSYHADYGKFTTNKEHKSKTLKIVMPNLKLD